MSKTTPLAFLTSGPVSSPTKDDRRLCDVLAAEPFRATEGYRHAVAQGKKQGLDRTIPLHTLQTKNTQQAHDLVQGHLHVLFVDEVLQSMSTREEVVDAISGSPRPVPMFDKMFLEGRPFKSKIENDFWQIGARVQRVPVEDHHDEEVKGIVAAMNNLRPSEDYPKVAWAVMFSTYAMQLSGAVWGPLVNGTYFLDENHDKIDPNVFLIQREQSLFKQFRCVFTLDVGMLPPGYSEREISEHGLVAMAMVIKALGLANCSNIEYREAGHTNDDKSDRQRTKRKLAWVKYHVLKLKKGTKYVDLVPRTGEGEQSMPLHMVRGHFRDYSRGKGLFGKYKKQAVWVPAHVRGAEEHGVVVKDYTIDNEGTDNEQHDR